MPNTYKTLVELGTIHKNEKRIIKVSVTERTDEKGKSISYLNFHEHWFKTNEQHLIPRKPGDEKEQNSKYKSDNIISFTLPYNTVIAKELANIANNLVDFLTDTQAPKEKEFSFEDNK